MQSAPFLSLNLKPELCSLGSYFIHIFTVCLFHLYAYHSNYSVSNLLFLHNA